MATTANKAASAKQAPPTTTDATTEQPSINRKKQKRREKQAAKLAAQGDSAHTNSTLPNGLAHARSPSPLQTMTTSPPQVNGISTYLEGYHEHMALEHVHTSATSKSKRKKKKAAAPMEASDLQDGSHYMPGSYIQPPLSLQPPPPPQPSNSITKRSRNSHKRSIWNTSTDEERERIKEFWIGLDEVERRSLVKVEKEAVLKKMKEQQKHSCSCTVCGRKRNAIEEELEVLYDAYYNELEQYANDRPNGVDGEHPMLPPPTSYSSLNRNPHSHIPQTPRMAGTFIEDGNGKYDSADELEDDEDYDDEDYDDEEYESDEPPNQVGRNIYQIGQHLTAQGGILTVADDLLKNDGKQFIEMMEQLAERRMQREEEASYAARGLVHPSSMNQNHALDDDEYDDEDDDDYVSDDDDDYDEDDEMVSMSSEQRMEEGRKMFQIFAARMFEQRVLTAYREKVARERQEQLLEEIADEGRLDEQREAKRARDAAKKKEKKNKQKAAKEEERLKREAEKAAQEAAEREAEEQRLEEQRARREAQRKKKEAEKQAQEAERAKKEADKQRRQHEAKEQQLEQEKKQRENKEKEKKRKDELKKKDREEREAREKAKREQEAAIKAETQTREAREREAREKARKEEPLKPITQSAPVAIPLARKPSSTIPIPPGLGSAATSAPSPHLAIATPSIPKASAPMRPKQPSRQGSIQSSPKSTTQQASSSATSPSTTNVPQSAIPAPPSKPLQHHPLHAPINPMPLHHPPPGILPLQMQLSGPPPGLGSPGFPQGFSPALPPGIPHRGPMIQETAAYSSQPFESPVYRGFASTPSTIGFPPGINPGTRQLPPGRGSPSDAAATVQAPIGTGITTGSSNPTTHSRNVSASFNPPGPIQPIGRPAAAARQSINSTRPADIEISQALGSSALLDDTDDTLDVLERPTHGNGPSRTQRGPFSSTPSFSDAIGSSRNDSFNRNGWGATSGGFGGPNLSNWNPSTPQRSVNSFSNQSGTEHSVDLVTLRISICQACRALSNNMPGPEPSGYGFHPVDEIIRYLSLQLGESTDYGQIVKICAMEGNQKNGGGILLVHNDRMRGALVIWKPDMYHGPRGSAFGVGEIGSPAPGAAFSTGTTRSPPQNLA